jgi:hypothetical protein
MCPTLHVLGHKENIGHIVNIYIYIYPIPHVLEIDIYIFIFIITSAEEKHDLAGSSPWPP